MSLTRQVQKASRRAAMRGDAMKEHRQKSGELRDPERSEHKTPIDLSVTVGKLADQALSDSRIFERYDRPEHAGAGGQVRGLPTGTDAVKIRRDNLLPDLIEAGHIKDINANVINAGTLAVGRLPTGVLIGKVKAKDEIDWGEGRPVPSGKVDKGYKYDDLDGKPSLGKYLTKNDVKPSALK